MTRTTWQHRLDAAHGEHELVTVAREFLAEFDPVELHALPKPCRPPARLHDGEDISSYAFELVRHECADMDGAGDLVHRLARFFSHASIRLSQITARVHAEDGDERASA